MKRLTELVKNPKCIWMCTLLLYAYPALLVGSLYYTWFVAWAVLGYQPRPSLDDPKYISAIVDIPYAMTMIMFMGFPYAAVIGVVMTPVSLASRIQSKSGLIVATLIGFVLLTVLWCAAIGFLRMDPWRVGTWYMD